MIVSIAADLFWQWSIAPGGLVPIRCSGLWTMTQSSAGHCVIWRYDRVYARGSLAAMEQRWSELA